MSDVRSEDRLTEQVLASVSGDGARLSEIARAAVAHLHAFVKDVGLSQSEWMAGIRFLTAVGLACTDTRQEFILLSDTMGVSSLVEMMSFDADPGATENTVLGPFYVEGSPQLANGDSIVRGEVGGTPLHVSGKVTDTSGVAIPGALVDVWQTAPNQLYAVQDPSQDPFNLRGKFFTEPDGSFAFETVRPVPYSVPDDGPVGRLLRQLGRHPMRPAHVHFMVSAPGYLSVTTHVFDAESPYLDSDTVFGVRESLVAPFEPDGKGGHSLRFDVALSGQHRRNKAA